MTEPSMSEGQSTEGLSGATGGDSQTTDGQSVASTNQTTGSGLGGAETFYDPVEYEQTLASLPDEIRGQVEGLKKSLQAGFTRKTQEMANDRHKIEAYNAFEANPLATIQQLAQQYGLQVLNGAPQQNQEGPWEPQDWNDVISKAKQEAVQEYQEQIKPLLNEVKNLKMSNMETYLDNRYPDWREYETDMISLLREHPTLAKSPDRLYQMAVPSKVLESRATQKALKKLQANQQGAQVSGQGTTTKPTTTKPDKPMTFKEAAEYALKQTRGL